MISKPQDNIPYAVSWVCFENGNLHHGINMLVAPDEGMAVGIVLASYYRGGGTLPLLAVKATAVSEDHARAAVAVYDDIAARNKAEADKVVQPKFGIVPVPHSDALLAQAQDQANKENPDGAMIGKTPLPDWKPPS